MNSIMDQIVGIECGAELPPSRIFKVTYNSDPTPEQQVDEERFAEYVGGIQEAAYKEIMGGMFEVMQRQANKNAKDEVDARLQEMKEL